MRKTILLFLTVAILLAVTACGNTGEQDSPAPESSVAGEPSEPDAVQTEREPPAAEESPSEPEDTALEDDVDTETLDRLPEQAEPSPVAGASTEQRDVKGGAVAESLRIRLSFDRKEAYATLYDTPPGRDFLTRLPLTLEFQDYVGEEKISYLDQALTIDSGAGAPAAGDFAYYAPWGNLVIFYNNIPSAGGGLIILGSMDAGKEQLAGMAENFTVTIELAE